MKQKKPVFVDNIADLWKLENLLDPNQVEDPDIKDLMRLAGDSYNWQQELQRREYVRRMQEYKALEQAKAKDKITKLRKLAASTTYPAERRMPVSS